MPSCWLTPVTSRIATMLSRTSQRTWYPGASAAVMPSASVPVGLTRVEFGSG